MNNPSIKLRIQVAVIILIVTTLSIASIILYLRIQKTFRIQTEKDLADIAVLVAREIEVNNNTVVDDWYDDIQADPISRKKDFIQSWGPQGIKTQRSPALGDMNLPFFHGELGEFVYQDVTLPHHQKTHQGRAVGLLVMPSLDGVPANKVDEIKKSLQPHTLVVAIDTARHTKFLTRLKWGMFLTILGITIFSVLIIHFILKSALFPIQNLAIEIQQKNIHQLDAGFIIQPKFPTELKGLVTQYNDLISRIESSRTREKNFSSYVAHELRTPLTGISTTLELALNRPRENSFYQNSISDALEISKSMQRLIDRLKTLTLLQNNQAEIDNETIDLHSFLQSLWDELQSTAEKNALTITWKFHAENALIQTDQHLLYMLINNLLENAVTYATPESSIQIETQEVDQKLQFSISNKTNHLTPSDLDLLFDPFYRKDEARVIDGHHFGMGLSICQEISRTLDVDLTASINQEKQFCIQCLFSLDF